MQEQTSKASKGSRGKTAYQHLKEHLKKLDIVVENEYENDESETKIGFRKYEPGKRKK